MGMHGCDHEAMQQQLWSSANAMMVSYWDSFRQPGPEVNSPAELAPALQVRLFHCMPLSLACQAPPLVPGCLFFSRMERSATNMSPKHPVLALSPEMAQMLRNA